jgi:hypothetical protein
MLSAALGPKPADSAPFGLNANAGSDIVAMMPVATVMTPTLRIQPPLRLAAGLGSAAAGLAAAGFAAAGRDGVVAAGAFAARSDRRETTCEAAGAVAGDVEERESGS